MANIKADVTDTNGRGRGKMEVTVSFGEGGPYAIRHNGNLYVKTGKTGHNIKTGIPVVELGTEDEARIWSSLDGSQIWED